MSVELELDIEKVRQELANLELDIEEVRKELARRELMSFVQYTKPDYQFNWHHINMCEKLDLFIAGKIKKLAIFMPPQHGKSELSTRRVPAMMLGLNKKLRIAIASYSSTVAKSFNMEIQQIIDSAEYHEIFPESYLSQSTVVDEAKGALRNTNTFQLVGHQGSLKSVGVDGSLTSFPVDIMIYDDLYKNREESLSSTINERTWSFIINVARMRQHNDSQELLVMTRWHEDDVAGRLIAKERDWEVISYPAIKVDENNPEDPRKIGEALWPSKHSKERILSQKALSQTTFDASYQQDPKAPEDLLIFPSRKYNDKTDQKEPAIFLIDKMPNQYPRVVGMDFGFTNDVTAIIDTEFATSRSSIYLDEWIYETGLLNGDIDQAYKDLGYDRRVQHICDVDPKDKEELRRKYKFNIKQVSKPKTLLARLTDQQAIKYIFVTRRSKNLILEFKKYQWITVGGKPVNIPLGNGYDHGHDAWGYAYLEHLNKRFIR